MRKHKDIGGAAERLVVDKKLWNLRLQRSWRQIDQFSKLFIAHGILTLQTLILSDRRRKLWIEYFSHKTE